VPVHEEATITRLGQGVDATKRLAPEAIDRTIACLERYRDAAALHGAGKFRIAGTSAMRDAAGAEIVQAAVERLFGVKAEVLSGDEEALCTFGGALSGLGFAKDSDVVVFDIGGGSTEFVRGAPGQRPSFAKSFDVGSVRMTERHIKSDPPKQAEIDAARADIARVFDALPRDAKPGPGAKVVGIAGTVTTFAAMSQQLRAYDANKVHGSKLSRDSIESLVDMLSRTPLDARKHIVGLDPKRADVIMAGGLVLLGCLDVLHASELVVSDRGVRWGLAASLVQ
jgi:exopolyphosphatase/guanosine-5'-triphosphate,3'-diphosphate pyrophosphatase